MHTDKHDTCSTDNHHDWWWQIPPPPLLTLCFCLKVSVASLKAFDEVPLSPLPAKVGKGMMEEEEEGEDIPDGVMIDPLFIGDNGMANGHS